MKERRFMTLVAILSLLVFSAVFISCSGDDGATGPAGAAGAAGADGADGATGPAGADGSDGAAGAAGADGADGATGSAGADGATGSAGAAGAAGADGAAGVGGADGKSAYDIAVDNGFDGTAQQWLVSLRPPSAAGETADEAAAAGYTGSEAQLLTASYEEAAAMSYSGTAEEWAALQDAANTAVALEVAASAVYESCAVCHTAGDIADIALAHPDPSDPLTVTVTAVTDDGAGILTVDFSLSDSAGDGVTGIGLDGNRFYLSDIVPAGTAASYLIDDPANPGTDIAAAAGTWDTDYLERWAYERDSSSYPTGTWTDLGGGDYTYAFVTALGSAEALAEAPDYDPTHVQRLVMRVDGRSYGYTRAVGIQDFMVDGTLLDPQRVLAPIEGCKGCHSPEMENAAHGGSYLDTRACVMCHSPLGHYGETMQADDAYASLLYHKLHSEIPMDAFDNRIWVDANGDGIRTADERHSYDYITFPQDVRSCELCHTGADDMTDAWQTHPTAEVCGSCHEDADWTTGVGHAGGIQTNDACAACHPATGDTSVGGSITFAHDTAEDAGRHQNPANVMEFDVTITMTEPDNGTHYVAGETPMVTVTLKNHSDGTDVDPSLYTTAADDEGIVGGGLSAANLYVYGPRAKAVPVLTTGSSTDADLAAGANPRQGHSLLIPSTDPLVSADATGFHYQLMAIPDDMAAGTYMVRFEGADYGGITTADYVTSTSGLINFQVETDTVEMKVAGDSCLNCHGDTRRHLEGSHAHNAPFDTDHCLGCHDQSGNYAVPIANRVHAVHSTNSDGDLYTIGGGSRDWSHVTFPQGSNSSPAWTRPKRCVTCHSSGNVTYKTKPFMMPCAGCHVGREGVVDHMRQNGGPF